ncbi:F-box/LRR-repeat protein 6 [Pholidichthys leucotaenia]
MDVSDAEASFRSQHEEKPKKISLKRKKHTKTRKKKISRYDQPSYTVHQGEGMVFVISGSSSQYEVSFKSGRKKKVAKRRVKANPPTKKNTVPAQPKVEKETDTDTFARADQDDHRWGHSLPEEVLIHIFQMVVSQDGAVPFLCRVGRVCRLWNAAASSPVLWRQVTVSYCWIAPDKTQRPRLQKKIQDTFDWLAQNRFSQLREFSLCHWKYNIDQVVEVVSRHSPHLSCIKLSYCKNITANAFHSLGLHSRDLQSIDLEFSEFHVEGLMEYLEVHGVQIKQILFTHGQKSTKLLAAIAGGCCPNLELLEINTKLDSKECELLICFQALQMRCPKLKTFRVLNIRPLPKAIRSGASSMGFPFLEELCIATTSFCYMTDKELWDILFNSPKLRVLDLRGCWRVTPLCLAELPCLELECLFWGQYSCSNQDQLSWSQNVLYKLAQKWSRTLQQLDISNHFFSEKDLELTMNYLAQTEPDTLRSLDVSGTRITPEALRPVLGQMTALGYLNLTSCRSLPRGVKKIYRSKEDIRKLLDIIK